METASASSLNNQLNTEPRVTFQDWHALLFLYSLCLVLLIVSWGRLPDTIIDFGRELYVPWQLTEGKVLYDDVAYFNGPASPYFNALIFKLFGVSFTTLSVVNATILGGILYLAFSQLRKFFPLATTTIACTCFVILQGFGHVPWLGNYNYISPYSHEMTHGIFLSLSVMWLLFQSNTRQWWRTFLAGLCWGLIFLGKPSFSWPVAV